MPFAGTHSGVRLGLALGALVGQLVGSAAIRFTREELAGAMACLTGMASHPSARCRRAAGPCVRVLFECFESHGSILSELRLALPLLGCVGPPEEMQDGARAAGSMASEDQASQVQV